LEGCVGLVDLNDGEDEAADAVKDDGDGFDDVLGAERTESAVSLMETRNVKFEFGSLQ
jgi:hypothetical protein